jgi:hypothetical protein
MTSFATGVTAHALTVALPEPAPELPDVVLVTDELADPVVQPPTTNADTSTTHGDHRREPCACSDSVTSAPCIAITTTGNVSASSRQRAFTSPERSEAAAGRGSRSVVAVQDVQESGSCGGRLDAPDATAAGSRAADQARVQRESRWLVSVGRRFMSGVD